MNDQRLAQTFVELADTLVDEFDLVEFLHILVDRCVELLDVSAAGLMLADFRGRLQVVASSSENIRLLELFQLQNDDGPCLECYRTGQPVNHPNLASADDRWPRFAPAATQAGFRTVHALPMRLRAEILGAFNLFHSDAHQLDSSVTQIGQAMADVATIGLIHERSLRDHETLIDQLQTALNSRIIVEQANGLHPPPPLCPQPRPTTYRSRQRRGRRQRHRTSPHHYDLTRRRLRPQERARHGGGL
jgi:transcriptional regulator with GAF, ATPase, and Fis domain